MVYLDISPEFRLTSTPFVLLVCSFRGINSGEKSFKNYRLEMRPSTASQPPLGRSAEKQTASLLPKPAGGRKR